MRALWIKLLFFGFVWYEVWTELGVEQRTAFALTLLMFGVGVSLVEHPDGLAAMLGPWIGQLLGPGIIWVGLAYWLAPRTLSATPTLFLIGAALLGMAGAALRYAVIRHPARVLEYVAKLRALISPSIVILLGLADQSQTEPLTLAVIAMLIAMPMRLGWRFLDPTSTHKFDAKMGSERSFRRDGFSNET